jgi:hypothetical protein
MKIISAETFMVRSKIYSSMKSESKITKLLASTKRATALQRLGVKIQSSSMSGNASANIRTSGSPVVFDSDWVNSIFHQLKNDNDLRGLNRVYECNDGELYCCFSDDTDLRKVINPMWRGIQAWNLTMLAFERIDEEQNALVYIQRAGDSNNHAAPGLKPNGLNKANDNEDVPEDVPVSTEPEVTVEVKINSSAEVKALSKADTAKAVNEAITKDSLRPRGIVLQDIDIKLTGNVTRIEADVTQVNSKKVELDCTVTTHDFTAMDDYGTFSIDLRCVVGNTTLEDTAKISNGKVKEIRTVIKDLISRTAKKEVKDNVT